MLYGKTEMFFNAQHENTKSYYIYNLDGSDSDSFMYVVNTVL